MEGKRKDHPIVDSFVKQLRAGELLNPDGDSVREQREVGF
jgi:hypothetical protein